MVLGPGGPVQSSSSSAADGSSLRDCDDARRDRQSSTLFRVRINNRNPNRLPQVHEQRRARQRSNPHTSLAPPPHRARLDETWTPTSKRRRPDSNRGMTDLQSVALGHLATAPATPSSATGTTGHHRFSVVFIVSDKTRQMFPICSTPVIVKPCANCQPRILKSGAQPVKRRRGCTKRARVAVERCMPGNPDLAFR